MNLIQRFETFLKNKRLQKFIRRANKLKAETTYKYIVLDIANKLYLYRRKDFKKYLSVSKEFKGVSIHDFDKFIVYSTK